MYEWEDVYAIFAMLWYTGDICVKALPRYMAMFYICEWQRGFWIQLGLYDDLH